MSLLNTAEISPQLVRIVAVFCLFEFNDLVFKVLFTKLLDEIARKSVVGSMTRLAIGQGAEISIALSLALLLLMDHVGNLHSHRF